MKRFSLDICTLMCIIAIACINPAKAQDPPLQGLPILGVDNTIGSNRTHGAIAYWTGIMAADDGTLTGPSLKSVIVGLSLQAEWSADETAWHPTRQPNDAYVRLRLQDANDWLVIPLGDATATTQLTAPQIVTLLTGLTGADRLSYNALKELPTIPTLRTPVQLVTALQGLTGTERLGYAHIDGTPSLTPMVEYSVDGSTAWHATYVSGTDLFYRLRIGTADWSSAIPIGETNVQLSGGTITGIAGGTGIDVATNAGEVTISLSANATVAWGNITDKPATATRWATASEITGLDAHIQQYLEGFGLTGPQAPFVRMIARQFLRRNSAYELNLRDYVQDAQTFLATNLPTGIQLSGGYLRGTPTTEQVTFASITARNSDGDTEFLIPFIVLRDVKFSADRRGYTGLTIKGTNLAALYAPTSGSTKVYFFDKFGTAQAPIAGTTLATSTASNVAQATGIAWTARDTYGVIGRSNGSTAILQYQEDGAIPTPQRSNTLSAIQDATGIATEATRLYILNAPGGLPQVRTITTARFEQFGSGVAIRAAGMDSPQGLFKLGSAFYVVDASADKVFNFSDTGSRGSSQLYREFDLSVDNTEPTGLAYLDNYFYVTEQGQGAINDDIFLYPSKELYDPGVPELLKLETLSRGTFTTGNAIRVRATFSGPVDIASDVTLRLELGNTERQAISVASQTGTTAAVQSDVTVANFYYLVQATDVDADGITTYDYPFGQTGNIYPAGQLIAAHSLNSGDSAYRVVQPPGLAGLHPVQANNVNSVPQADWNQTDSAAPDFVKNKPTELVRFPNTASLANFGWMRDDTDGIQYETSGTAYNQINFASVAQQQDWNVSRSFNAGHWLLVRVPQAAVANLAALFPQGIGYNQHLANLNSDTETWFAYNSGAVHSDGYFYYARKAAMTASGTVYSAKRMYPYTALSGTPTIPPAPVNADWDADSGLAQILNKPNLEIYQSGEDATIANIVRASSQTIRITPSQKIRDAARAHGTKPHLSLAVHWRTAATPAGLAEAQGRISVEEEPPTRDDYEGQFAVLPRTTYTVTTASLNMEPDDTAYLIELERDGEDPNPSPDIEVEKLVWRISLADVSQISAGEGIDITGDVVSLADNGVTQDKINFDGTPKQGQELFIDAGGAIGTGYRFLPEEPTANSALRVALTTGTPTLASVQTLTYAATVEATGSDRNGQVVIVRIDDGTDTTNYLIVTGDPGSSADGATSQRIPLAAMTQIGTAGGYTYLRSNGITVPANTDVEFHEVSDYAAEQVLDLIRVGGGHSGAPEVTNVTGAPPIVVTGTTNKVVSLPDDTITPQKLLAGTDAEEKAFRDTLDLEVFEEFSNTVTNQGTGQHRVDFTIPTNVVTAAVGSKPFEVRVSGTLTARASATVEVSIKLIPGTQLGTVGDAAGIITTSTSGATANWSLSGMIQPHYRNYIILFERRSATGFYDATLAGRIKVGQRADHVYVASSGFHGNLATTDDTVQKMAQKLNDLVVSGIANRVPDQILSATQYTGTSQQPLPLPQTININENLIAHPIGVRFTIVADNTTAGTSPSLTITISTYLTTTPGEIILRKITTVDADTTQTIEISGVYPALTRRLYIRGNQGSGTSRFNLTISGVISTGSSDIQNLPWSRIVPVAEAGWTLGAESFTSSRRNAFKLGLIVFYTIEGEVTLATAAQNAVFRLVAPVTFTTDARFQYAYGFTNTGGIVRMYTHGDFSDRYMTVQIDGATSNTQHTIYVNGQYVTY